MNTNTDSIDQEFCKTFKQMMEENISITEARSIEDDVTGPEPYNTFIHMRRAVGPLDILKSINESIRSGNARNFSNTASLFLRQFTSGRNDMENVTTATMLLYFALARLSDDPNTFGSGFSTDSLTSTGTLAKSILAKRILPVAVGETYLEWADDTSQEITGTSISGAAANGLANFIGAAISNLIDAGNGRLTRKMMAAGSTAASAGHFLSGGNSMVDEITSGGALGYNIVRFFKKNRELGTAIGLATGSAYRLAFGDSHEWIRGSPNANRWYKIP